MKTNCSDILGLALCDFHFNKREDRILIYSPDFDPDEIPVKWYFRDYQEMPEIEKYALSLCRGKILDAGAGAGIHSLWLKGKDLDITALDISEGACRVMKDRGLEKVLCISFPESVREKFDTILMLMNGIGITGNLDGMKKFLDKLPDILNPGGQVIFDSSNLIYLLEDEDGIAEIDLNDKYIGEIEFQLEYAGQTGDKFPWLYIDFDLISEMCERRNYRIELLKKGENLHYLARIVL